MTQEHEAACWVAANFKAQPVQTQLALWANEDWVKVEADRRKETAWNAEDAWELQATQSKDAAMAVLRTAKALDGLVIAAFILVTLDFLPQWSTKCIVKTSGHRPEIQECVSLLFLFLTTLKTTGIDFD